MKKRRLLSCLLCVAMTAALLVGCGSSSSGSSEDTSSASTQSESTGESYKVGITVQSLSNAYWAGSMSRLGEAMEAKGWEYSLVDCDDNSGTQLSQIENFITSGVDLILVHPSDPDAIESVCKDALDAGIKVFCWDDEMTNTSLNWVLDNTELGEKIGENAAEFINAHYTSDNKAQVCVIGYPSTKILLERANGIKQGLEEYCEDNYEIVAETDGLEAAEAQTNVESVLSAHPDCKVFVGIGAGAMIGANEALLQQYGGAGNIPEDVGVITTDVTTEQLESLKAGDEAVRSIIGFEGSHVDTANACVDLCEQLLEGKEFTGDDHNVWRSLTPITSENIDEILEGM